MAGRRYWPLLFLVPFLVAPAGASDPVPPPFRPLRDNAPAEMLGPAEPVGFSGYPGAPPFSVVPRKDQLTFFPCTACHADLKPNPVPRLLSEAPHNASLHHGDGRFWCLDCHQLKDRDHLHTLAGQPVDFDAAYLVCGQCHAARQRDWFFGAHGKRVANWRGERTLYNCTVCHDPHSPGLKPRAPSPPPPVRAGLQRMPATPKGSTSGLPFGGAPPSGERR
jgi:hypothetical protein